MANETNYYFGAYLEIKTKEQEKNYVVYSCENNHKQKEGNFCGQCGKPVIKKIETTQEYPVHYLDLLSEEDYEKYEDELHIITPPSIYESGLILAINNRTADDSCWLHLSRDGNETELKKFPSEAEIQLMESSLLTEQSQIIKALQKHDNVLSIEVNSGYVLDAEY